MELRVRDVAAILNESEDTIIRWAQRGIIPSHHIKDQFLFNGVELQEWATLNNHYFSTELFAHGCVGNDAACLPAAIERGGVYYQVEGNTREQVLEAVTGLPGIPAGVDKAFLLELLVGREALSSTAFGNGIAIPHPRNPLVVPIHEPSVLLCFLAKPVDFHATDGQPVRALFTLLSPSVRTHLQMLGRIGMALHDERFAILISEQAAKGDIFARLHELEVSLAAGVADSAHGRGTAPKAPEKD